MHFGLASYLFARTRVAEQEANRVDEVVIGVVTAIDDPLRLCRVRVAFPSLSSHDDAWWASVIQPGAGNDRGWFSLPEVGDEVLCAFEHGDIGRPVVLGALWNGKDKAPDKNDGANERRAFVSRSGSKILMDDAEDQLAISDGGGIGSIVLSKTALTLTASSGDVALQCKDDLGVCAGEIEIKGTTVSLIGKSSKVNATGTAGVKISAANVALKGSTIDINPGGVESAAKHSGSVSTVDGGDGGGGGSAGSAGGAGGGGAGGGGAGGASGGGAGGASGGGGSMGTTPGGGPDSALPPTQTDLPIDPHTIEILIVNALGAPQPGIRFSLRLPDGRTRSGATGDAGLIRYESLDTPGEAKLVLPERDAEKGTVDGPRTPGAILYAAGGVPAQVGSRTTVELEPRVYRGRMTGLTFDNDRAFLLPGAFEGIRLLKRFYDEHPASQVLVSGHADAKGGAAHNLSLSEERAAAVAAFLTDDVDAWLRHYRGTPGSATWGTREDQYMLATITDGDGQPYLADVPGDASTPAVQDAVRRFQTDRGLAVDGVAGNQTRTALIGRYMAADDTTLPPDTVLQTHGCGESHPADPIAANDGEAAPENRRVEIFLFEGPIDPAPVPRCPQPAGCSQYAQWVERSIQHVEFRRHPGAARVSVIDRHELEQPDVAIHLSGPTSGDGTTGGDGVAFLDNLAPGTYAVIASREGFEDTSVDLEITDGVAEVTLVLFRPIDWALNLAIIPDEPITPDEPPPVHHVDEHQLSPASVRYLRGDDPPDDEEATDGEG